MTHIDATLDSRSSTLRSESGKQPYISTTSRITSGELLKRRKGLGGVALDRRLMSRRYPSAASRSTLL